MTYSRSEIWMVDFGNPVGTELAAEHPAVIVSRDEINITRVIVVPGTSTQTVNNKGETILSHETVDANSDNGLKNTTYFMAEQVRSVSVGCLRRLMGRLDGAHIRGVEDRLCLVMRLFQS